MRSHAESLIALFFYVFHWLFGAAAHSGGHHDEPHACVDAGVDAGPGPTAGSGGAADSGLPTPEQYCALPADDECWPCGAAGESQLVLQLGAACAADCAALVASIGGDCTGRCTSEDRCVLTCPPALSCPNVDPSSEDCDSQCGSGSGGRVYRHMDNCVNTICNDALNAGGQHPNCRGVCVSTSDCKLECQ